MYVLQSSRCTLTRRTVHQRPSTAGTASAADSEHTDGSDHAADTSRAYRRSRKQARQQRRAERAERTERKQQQRLASTERAMSSPRQRKTMEPAAAGSETPRPRPLWQQQQRHRERAVSSDSSGDSDRNEPGGEQHSDYHAFINDLRAAAARKHQQQQQQSREQAQDEASDSAGRPKRKRTQVVYTEPKVNTKLRKGYPFTFGGGENGGRLILVYKDYNSDKAEADATR